MYMFIFQLINYFAIDVPRYKNRDIIFRVKKMLITKTVKNHYYR